MTDYSQISPNPLTNLRGQIREHWSRYRPMMFAEMEAKGTLAEAIDKAANLTQDAIFEYVSEHGMEMTPAQAFWSAWEIFRNEWAFLPAEEGFDDSIPFGEDEEEEDEGEAVPIYRALLRRQAAEATVRDIWDEKNARFITPFVWDEETEELVPSGQWDEEAEEWTPDPGYEDLNPLESGGGDEA